VVILFYDKCNIVVSVFRKNNKNSNNFYCDCFKPNGRNNRVIFSPYCDNRRSNIVVVIIIIITQRKFLPCRLLTV